MYTFKVTPLTACIAVLCITAAVLLSAEDSAHQARKRPLRIVNDKYEFGVTCPSKWFVFLGGELPVFFNFRAEKAGIQGRFPPGGASIRLLVRQDRVESLAEWAEREIDAQNGIDARRSDIAGPPDSGSRALRVVFDEPVLSPQLEPMHFGDVFWRSNDRSFGAELSYYEKDSKGRRYEGVLMEVVQSFRLHR
jgi:hypothetical protein